MSKSKTETGVILPENNIIDVEWAKEQLQRVDIFSQELLNYGRGEIFFMLFTNLSQQSFDQAIPDLGYTTETAQTYISYLQKRPILEAIKAKFYVALSLSAAEYIPDNIEDAMALMDVCLAKFGKPTADNLKRACETTGTLPKKMSDAAISIETMKKKALHEWLLDEHSLSEDDIYMAQKLHPEGRTEFTEKMTQAYFLLEDWKPFYTIIAAPIHASGNAKALRFLSDINDASASIMEYIKAETANRNLTNLKAKFEAEVYPELSFNAK